MAKCIHGNVIDQCGLCRIESHKNIYGNFEGEVSTTQRPKGRSRPHMNEVMKDVDLQAEQEKQDELMEEYVKNSFITESDNKKDKSE